MIHLPLRPEWSFRSSNIVVAADTLLDASGRNVTLSGSNTTRLFLVNPGMTLTLVNLTLADGCARGTNGNAGQPGGAAEGGAIYNNGGTVMASGCAFLRNKALGGNGGMSPSIFVQAGPGGAARGGVIYNTSDGQVIATNCFFALNHALGGDGGGIGTDSTQGGEGSGGMFYNTRGNVVFSNCRVLNNSAASGRNNRFGGYLRTLGRGGAIYHGNGQLTLSRVELASNSVGVGMLSGAQGGAIHLDSGTLTMAECHLHDNHVQGGSGAGIGTPLGFPGGPSAGGSVSINSGIAQITGSTLANSIAIGGQTASTAGAGSGSGGGIFNAGILHLENSTILGNQALAGGVGGFKGSGYGGGLYNSGGTMVLIHATLAGNAARTNSQYGITFNEVEQGGGIFSTNGSVTLFNTIVANSPAGSNCFGTLVDGSHNLSSDASCNFTAPGSLNNTDPILGPLADYGGPTPTMALLASSPAIDAADGVFCPPTDQRGVMRPFGAGCDIGAFESAPPYTVVGHITGFLPPSGGITVGAETSSALVDSTGQYALHGLTAGSDLIMPTSPECIFIQSNRVVNIGPDIAGVDFYSYRSNALLIARSTNQAVHGTFAGETGATYRVLSSPDLLNWSPWSTNAAESSGLFEFYDTNVLTQPLRFFEVVRP